MTAILVTARRLLTACAFAVVALAPAVTGIAAAPTNSVAPLADCPTGEDGDVYTGTCAPYLVPNSPEAPAVAPTPDADLCPPGVSGSQCTPSTGGKASPSGSELPGSVAPSGPEQSLQDVSTPDF
ncbi:hypothetical protein A5740_08405 [Mycobacterium sp. GA-1841]|uniref:hypothetical protein n=1 Tax=Mycobacterium sp. GA-1841 TaxID=1834154 RepID=UPI00096E0DD4|nr:hypothetical protein [Mycobacterium sp. GA-1841]OMC35124.1 hypothetical protein A5740_08405 [Mycobacterium sp. GA-1841]